MIINKTSCWDQQFFNQFCQIKTDLYQHDENAEPETIQDLQDLFSGLDFENIEWTAVFTDKARLALFFSPNQNQHRYVHFGLFEAKSPEDALPLLPLIDQWAKEKGVNLIKGPIDGHFFYRYRFRIGPKRHLFGEPYHLEWYPNFFEEHGYQISKSWTTTALETKINQKRFKNYRKTKDGYQNNPMTLKFVFPWRFKQYFHIIHQLFVESYSQMSEYQPLQFETFLKWHGDLCYLINPFFSYVIFQNEKPVGFLITLFDVRSQIVKAKRNSSTGLVQKILTLTKIHLNHRTLLIMYIGKLQHSPKGMLALTSKYIALFFILFRSKEAFVCLRGEDSPASHAFKSTIEEPFAKYVVLQKFIT